MYGGADPTIEQLLEALNNIAENLINLNVLTYNLIVNKYKTLELQDKVNISAISSQNYKLTNEDEKNLKLVINHITTAILGKLHHQSSVSSDSTDEIKRLGKDLDNTLRKLNISMDEAVQYKRSYVEIQKQLDDIQKKNVELQENEQENEQEITRLKAQLQLKQDETNDQEIRQLEKQLEQAKMTIEEANNKLTNCIQLPNLTGMTQQDRIKELQSIANILQAMKYKRF